MSSKTSGRLAARLNLVRQTKRVVSVDVARWRERNYYLGVGSHFLAQSASLLHIARLRGSLMSFRGLNYKKTGEGRYEGSHSVGGGRSYDVVIYKRHDSPPPKKLSADKKKFPYGGLNSGRPITPPRGGTQKKGKK